MDKVLIVDGDKELLVTLKAELDRLHHFETLIAPDGGKAIEILSSKKISVFVTDVNTPTISGLDLIAYITQNYPNTPCIVMTDYGKPWFSKRMEQQENLYHIEKPFEIKSLASSILVGLSLLDEGVNYQGITIKELLPLIEIEQKTCRMEVDSRDKGKGYLYFDKGELFDAHYKEQSGEKAALEISQWGGVSVKFTDLPRRRNRPRVKSGLMTIAGATWRKGKIENYNLSDTIDRTESVRATAEIMLERNVKEFHAIKGYKAVAILDPDGKILAQDSIDPAIDMVRLAGGLSIIRSVAEDSSGLLGFNCCKSLSLHTTSGTVFLESSNLIAGDKLRLVGVISEGGNWFFMKYKLENFLRQMVPSTN